MTDGVTVKVGNIDRLLARFRKLAPTADEEMRKAALAGANDVAAVARRFVPRGTDEERELHDSIAAFPMEKRPGAIVVAGGETTRKQTPKGAYNYAAAQEFGTAEMGANPFLYPANRLLSKKNRNRMSRAMTKAAKRVAAK